MLYRLFFVTISIFFSLELSAQCVSGNCHNGSGIYRYTDSSVYKGKFLRNKRNGKGKMIYANKDIYIGMWKSNKRNGSGELRYADGNRYRGAWKNGFASGKGTLTFANGEKYSGSFSRGKMHGKGTFFSRDGSIYRGDWSDNQRHGHGQIVSSAGSKRMVEYIKGQEKSSSQEIRNEVIASNEYVINEPKKYEEEELKDCTMKYCDGLKAKYIYVNGAVYEGWFKNGEPNGVGVCRYPNGDVYQGEWAYHGPHGEGVFKFANGQVYAAEWDRARMVRQLNKPSEHMTILSDETKKLKDGEVKIWAVIVGVANYNHMPSLRYTDDDAYRFYAFLKSPEGGALPENQIKILVDENAKKSTILKEMQTLYMQADADDVVMFYFSGHGLEGSFIPSDYDGYNNQLYHKEINQVLDASTAKHKVCFADACHAGSFDIAAKTAYGASLDNFYSSFTQSQGGTALLLSSKAEEVSLEYSGLRQGIFSHFLMRGLAGESNVNNDKLVTLGELSDYVQREVKSYTAGKQSPRIIGDSDLTMPVAMLR